jgi:LmbE family N-acetylglucosaminyl deacetylase
MRVQFISPHPDDVEIFCGGTFLRHLADGDQVAVLLMTRGGAGTLLRRRRGAPLEATRTAEATRRYAAVPVAGVTWLGFRDGEVPINAAAIATLRRALADFDPQLIYLPESTRERSYYWHRDHLHTGRVVEQAASGLAGVTCRYYHSRHVNRVIDVDEFFAASQTALRFHASQYLASANPPFLLHLLEWLRRLMLRARGRRADCRYAEGFREAGPQAGA